MSYLGDFFTSDVVYKDFTSIANTSGAPTSLSGGTVKVLKDNGTSYSTAGVTLTADIASTTGLNSIAIDTSADGTFYASGHDFMVVVTAGTVGGQSIAGYVVGQFSLQNRTGLRPATKGRTLGVSASGQAGVDWANVGSPTTTLNLSGTTVAAVSGAVGSVTGAVASVTGNVGGNVVGSVASVTGSVASVTGAVGSVTGNVGGNVVGSVASVTGAVGSVTGAVGSVTGNVGGNVVGSVASVTGAVGSVTGNVGGNVTGSIGSLATQAKTDAENAIWNAATSSHTTTSQFGGFVQALLSLAQFLGLK